ncbi:MAG: hypothetical protein ACJ790_02740, partial [Myxococcaceae bacterium]
MAHLDFFFLVYTDGDSPRPLTDPEIRWHELPNVPLPNPGDELFGPWAGEASRELKKMRRAFLFEAHRDRLREPEQFFAHVNGALASSISGLRGYAVDVLRLWPLPIRELEELPQDPLPEDLFAVGFEDVTAGGIRAQSFGLAKLGQREVRFTFTDRSLMDEAALLVAHLADYAMHHSRRVEHGQTMSFGFDRLTFQASEGAEAGGPFRAWHAPLVQAVLPEEAFTGVGMLDLKAHLPLSEETTSDLTDVLRRSLLQRLLLEELGMPGDAPSQHAVLRTCGCPELATAWKAVRDEPNASKDSGWSVTCVKAHAQKDLHERTVGDLTRRVASLLRYLALPPGCTVIWNGPT